LISKQAILNIKRIEDWAGVAQEMKKKKSIQAIAILEGRKERSIHSPQMK